MQIIFQKNQEKHSEEQEVEKQVTIAQTSEAGWGWEGSCYHAVYFRLCLKFLILKN